MSTPAASGEDSARRATHEARVDFAILLTRDEHRDLRPPTIAGMQLPRVPETLYAIWRLRPDLTRAFDLATTAGYSRLFVWGMSDGRRDDDMIARALDASAQALAAEVPGGPPDGVGLSWRALLCWLAEAPVDASPDLADPAVRSAIADWFVDGGAVRYHVCDLLTPAEIQRAGQTSPAAGAMPIVRLLTTVHRERPDLHVFDLATFEGCRDFVLWCFTSGRQEYGYAEALLERQNAAVRAWRAGRPSAGEPAAQADAGQTTG